MLQFDGQFCDLSAEEFADAGLAEELGFDELTPTVREHIDSTAGWLEKVRVLPTCCTAADLTRGFTMQCRYFWCANHRPCCNWSTIEQIQHRRGPDAWNNLMDDSIVPIESWNNQVVAAMPVVDLNQQPPCICPHLRATAGDRSGRFNHTQRWPRPRRWPLGLPQQRPRRRPRRRTSGGRGGARGASGDSFCPGRGVVNKENRAPANAGESAPAAAVSA